MHVNTFFWFSSFFETKRTFLSTIPLFLSSVSYLDSFERRVATYFYFWWLPCDPRIGKRTCAENEYIFATGELRLRMEFTLATVGPADVQDEWNMKLGSFPGR